MFDAFRFPLGFVFLALCLVSSGCATGQRYYNFTFKPDQNANARIVRDTIIITYGQINISVQPTQTGFNISSENDNNIPYTIAWDESRYFGINGPQPLIVFVEEGDYRLASRFHPAGNIDPYFSFSVHVVGLLRLMGKRDKNNGNEQWEEIGHLYYTDLGDPEVREALKKTIGTPIELHLAVMVNESRETIKLYSLRWRVSGIESSTKKIDKATGD